MHLKLMTWQWTKTCPNNYLCRPEIFRDKLGDRKPYAIEPKFKQEMLKKIDNEIYSAEWNHNE